MLSVGQVDVRAFAMSRACWKESAVMHSLRSAVSRSSIGRCHLALAFLIVALLVPPLIGMACTPPLPNSSQSATATPGPAQAVDSIACFSPATLVASYRATFTPHPVATNTPGSKNHLNYDVPYDVTLRCCLMLDDEGNLTKNCTAHNASGIDKQFLFCGMIDLQRFDDDGSSVRPLPSQMPDVPPSGRGASGAIHSATATPPGTGYVCYCLPANPTPNPTPPPPSSAGMTSYHFGCEVVSVGAMSSVAWSMPGDLPFVPPRSDWKEFYYASDFEVQYVDFIDVTADDDKTFKQDTCESVIGQAGMIDPSTASTGTGQSADISALWSNLLLGFWPAATVSEPFTQTIATIPTAIPTIPFSPVLTPQPIATFSTVTMPTLRPDPTGTPTLRAAVRARGSRPCAPPGFPLAGDAIEVCPAPPNAIPGRVTDRNLFYLASHMGEKESEWPAVSSLFLYGDTGDVRVETTPEPSDEFVMNGGEEEVSILEICDSSVTNACLIVQGKSPGDQMSYVIRYEHPDSGEFLFDQQGTFLSDEVPPELLEVSMAIDPNDYLHMRVVAKDATSQPLSAVLWFTLDNGSSWGTTQLSSGSSPFDDSKEQLFFGSAGPFLVPEDLFAVLVVADVVGNERWFGPLVGPSSSP